MRFCMVNGIQGTHRITKGKGKELTGQQGFGATSSLKAVAGAQFGKGHGFMESDEEGSDTGSWGEIQMGQKLKLQDVSDDDDNDSDDDSDDSDDPKKKTSNKKKVKNDPEDIAKATLLVSIESGFE